MNTLNELFAKLNNPITIENPSNSDWRILENQLRISLPDSYKNFISRFGSGRFLGSINFMNPLSSDCRRNFSFNALNNITINLRDVKPYNDFHSYKFYPDIHGLIPVGMTGLPKYFFLNPIDKNIVFIDFDDYCFACFEGAIDELLLKYIFHSNMNCIDIIASMINSYKNNCIVEGIPFFEASEYL